MHSLFVIFVEVQYSVCIFKLTDVISIIAR